MTHFGYIIVLLYCVSFFHSVSADTVSVESRPTFALVHEKKLYVTNADSRSVSVIDIEKKVPILHIPVGFEPTTLTYIGNTLYVGNTGSKTVYVIDMKDYKLLQTIEIQKGVISLFASGNLVYAVGERVITVLDHTTKKIKHLITAKGLIGVSHNTEYSAGKKIFIHHPNDVFLTIINTEKGTASFPRIGFGSIASAIIGKNLYIVNPSQKQVEVYHVDTLKPVVVDKKNLVFPVGNEPKQILSLEGKLYINNVGDNTITIIDPKKNVVKMTMNVGKNPLYMFRYETYLGVLNHADNTVSLIDTMTDTVIKVLQTGSSPLFGGMNQDILYSVNTSGNSVSIFDTKFPQLKQLSTSATDGTHGLDAFIKVVATFDTPLLAGSRMVLGLTTSRTLVLDTVLDKTLSGIYIVGPNEYTPLFSVAAIQSSLLLSASAIPAVIHGIPEKKNISDVHKIVIHSPALGLSSASNLSEPPCQKEGNYRQCLGNDIGEGKKEILLCEKLVTMTDTTTRFISRIEVLEIATRLLRKKYSPLIQYKNTFEDIPLNEKNAHNVRIVQTALDHTLIQPGVRKLKPNAGVSRTELYALFMKGICLSSAGNPHIGEKQVYNLARENGLFTGSWRRFRPNKVVSRSEVYSLALTMANWADIHGGCQTLQCRKK